MRAAVVQFAFDHLRATAARSGAFPDNPSSFGVSRRLGYRRDGTETLARRGRPVEQFACSSRLRPSSAPHVAVAGEECRAMLGGISPG